MKDRLKKILILELIIIIVLIFFILGERFEFIDRVLLTIEDFLFEEDTNPEIKELWEYVDRDEKDEIKDIVEEEKDQEDIVYSKIKEGLLEGEDSIIIKGRLLGNNWENFFHIVEEVLLDNPEIMYYTSGKYSNNTFYPSYNMPLEEKLIHQGAIGEERDYIISQIIQDNMSQYEKVKAVHDYIVNNTQYDKRHYTDEIIPNESYTVYGVLFEGIAVCEGYAKTMKYFLDEIGIETKIVIGTANGENHAWNIVKIDGDYYHIDTTWDDPVTEDGTDVLVYDFFNLKDTDIEKTHNWNRGKYPICNSDKYNYFYYNDLVVYDYEGFYNRLSGALINGKSEIFLKIPNYNKDIYNIPNTVKKIVTNNPNRININQYAYSINSYQNIIRIYFYK